MNNEKNEDKTGISNPAIRSDNSAELNDHKKSFIKGINKKILIITTLVIAVIAAGFLLYQNNIENQKIEYTGPMEKVTLAAYEGEASLLAYIAEEYDFFEQNGLDVKIRGFDSGKAAADELISGNADISTSASGVLVSNSFDLADLRALATVAELNVQGLIARKDRGITKPSDLAGKKIGVTKKSHGEFNLGVFLSHSGLSINDVESIDLKPGEIVESLVSGELDAGFTWEPNIYNADNELEGNVLVWKNNVPTFDFVLLSKNKWLDKNPATAERFINALVQAEQFVNQNEDKARKFMQEKFNYEQDYADSTWKNHDFTVRLTQSLILELESIAEWRIKNNLTNAAETPNYLNYLYLDALETIKPEAITIFR
jgi:NitT/TauT family transport system substrate-binding protein